MTEEQVEDIDVSLDRFLLMLEVLPLELLLVTGLVPVDLSIPMLELSFTVGKKVCRLWDVIVVLRVEGEMNFFAVFPIGATMQDSSKRKKDDEATNIKRLYFVLIFLLLSLLYSSSSNTNCIILYIALFYL